ncbi:MAG: hypothetical protein D4R67_06665 [Bacteroidetes bacterium]|nr:MAG: hypothetical protein D4R67_06665 [Bacteroidota bacterium]
MMELKERISFLKSTAIFEATPDPVLDQLARLLDEQQVDPGTVIIQKGETGDAMFLIVNGCVKVHDGDHLFTTLRCGDSFGIYHLIDQAERAASVTAVESTLLLCIAGNVFNQFISDPGFTTGILRTLVYRLREMNRNEEKLAELNATKDKFFSIIAHDLRAPLTTIISFSGMLKDTRGKLSEEKVNELINNQYDASWSSLKLLDNLIKWAQVQTGRLIPKPTVLNLGELVEDVVDFCLPSAEEKNIALVADFSYSPELLADQDMIRTAFVNLVNNAVKFTKSGGSVILTCTMDHDRVILSVQDTGVGMTNDQVESLFRIDKACSTEGTAHEQGTGLGLILCKEFVEMNGGMISVISQPGSGTTFTVSFPVTKSG